MDKDAQSIFRAAVSAVQADRLLDKVDWDGALINPLASYRRVVVAGMGKAAMAMASVMESRLGDRIDRGAVVVPFGYPDSLPDRFEPPSRVEVLESAHPVPDASSAHAARRLLELADGCEADDLLLVLISGGGTSLTADFAEDISLEDGRRTFRLLQEGGIDIHGMNVVRRHIGRMGGGRLARSAYPADVLALVVSDVVGNDMEVIASGPTVPDPATLEDAASILRDAGLWEKAPLSVREALDQGPLETPKPGDPLFERVRTLLVGSNETALEAAALEAWRLGYRPRIVTSSCTGEARDVARNLIAEARRAGGGRICLLWGGETTVTVRGSGKGGRNQEMALAAALALDGTEPFIVFLSAGTDGIDGATDSAGAWCTPETVGRARRMGLDPFSYLENNDSFSFWDRAGGLVRTGPTHTNVMDVQVVLVA